LVGGLIGSRIFYLAEHGGLTHPGQWLGSYGFTFYGGFIAVALGLAGYIWRTRASIVYLDLVALALPLGYAIGRVGDIIYGEHYGPASTFLLAVRNSNPGANVPNHALVYHNGGLYESLIGLAVFAIAWPLRERLLRRPASAVWLVLALLSAGRFVEFFVRSDSATVALGLETAQWTSLVLIAVAAVGALVTWRHGSRGAARVRRRSIFAARR